MKLKTKLVIAFILVMIFPTFVTMAGMHMLAPNKAGEIQQMYLIIVCVTTAVLVWWIYKTVSVPLAKLQEATRNIKEGNLDFEIKPENDDEIGQVCQDFEEMRLRLKARIKN